MYGRPHFQREPSCIVTDRELAQMHAITSNFPHSYVFLCTLHIKRDICGYLVREFKPLLQELLGSAITIKKGKDPLVELIVKYIFSDFAKLVYDTQVNIQSYLKNKEVFIERYLTLTSEFFRELNKDDVILPESFFSSNMEYLFTDFGTNYVKYLEKEWLPYDNMIAMCYKRLHRCFLLRGSLGTNNPAESMFSHLKFNHEYRKKNILQFITECIEISAKEYKRFLTGQDTAKILELGPMQTKITHGLYSELIGNVSRFAIERMYYKLNRVVELYNNKDFSYEGTCTILRAGKVKGPDGTLNIDENGWKEILKSDKNMCSCITQGLYCGEYQITMINNNGAVEDEDIDTRNFSQFAFNWKQNIEDQKVKDKLKKLDQKDISNMWKLLYPIIPPQVLNNAINQSSSEGIKLSNDEVENIKKKLRKLIMERRKRGIFEKFLLGQYVSNPVYKYESGIRSSERLNRRIQGSQDTVRTENSQSSEQNFGTNSQSSVYVRESQL